MASSTRITPIGFSDAIGNTAPVNLTQALPPDQDAAVLLLGCGDARNIIFSVYAGSRSGRFLSPSVLYAVQLETLTYLIEGGRSETRYHGM